MKENNPYCLHPFLWILVLLIRYNHLCAMSIWGSLHSNHLWKHYLCRTFRFGNLFTVSVGKVSCGSFNLLSDSHKQFFVLLQLLNWSKKLKRVIFFKFLKKRTKQHSDQMIHNIHLNGNDHRVVLRIKLLLHNLI